MFDPYIVTRVYYDKMHSINRCTVDDMVCQRTRLVLIYLNQMYFTKRFIFKKVNLQVADISYFER